MTRRFTPFNATALTLGFAFLYLPILILVVYSFNASRLVTVWGGFSTEWYAALFRNEALLDAAWVTIRIALVSAVLATLLGTMAAVTLVRYGRFRGRTLFTGLVYAPMVMPEVITGLSLLLLFVAIGFERGFWTVTLAHTTFAMCFVTVVVQSRLVAFDRALEEAAMDLGATPLRTFLSVTLPLIAPAVIAGFLLAFTLSLDDLVIANLQQSDMAGITDRMLAAFAGRLKCWQFHPDQTEGFAKAEVTVGGIDTRDLSSKTMAARNVKGLYAIGEAVDVTGWLGGYNFQWAWSSGWSAGQAI